MKLASPRSKDRLDVIELLKAGIDAARVRAYLGRHAPGLIEDFEAAVRAASSEEDG
jgi:hypothetical protein